MRSPSTPRPPCAAFLTVALAASLTAAMGAPTAAAETRAAGERFRDCAVCPEMVVIPAGPAGPRADAIEVAAFAIARVETSKAAWEACVAGGGCGGWRPYPADDAASNEPVVKVSLIDADAYVAWLNAQVAGAPYRLPSDPQWERAARGGARTAYPWGDVWRDENANAEGSGPGRPEPPGTRPPNGYGLEHMIGNVWEWTLGRPEAGGAAPGPQTRPRACETTLAGGSYLNAPGFDDAFEVTGRYAGVPVGRTRWVGFRVVRLLAD